MRIAVLTFEGFNELDSFVAAGLLNRMRGHGWQAEITSPTEWVTSMNGVKIQAQQPLEFANAADVVLFGSGMQTRAIAEDRTILDRLRLDPQRQLIGSQCSGALLMARLGLLGSLPACTDLTTKPWVIEAGVQVLDQPFYAKGNLATAGGCLSAPYLATWAIAKLAGEDACATVLHYVAPVGEKEAFVERALGVVRPYL
ncbi:DJ-1/PfpI family protein [Metapseudomonas boanensis]|uniref:DJ-1/PfpI family protein n=1 Tax=Metapseudomonas boanensis TaxID=2822138 RepID=A0ABS5XBE0_9GAMM|nr:DJ-1/PfpI family protein [Pseudomonas boanensis]MBT8764962.1 DJ-1/PfpI family protein [Pseudomonas boanensis]